MISNIFNTFLYQPFYNTLIYLIDILPGHNIGLAIIILTIMVKFCILPLTHKSTKSQAKMKSIEPEVQTVRDKYKNNKQEQARKIMELYKTHGVNPLSGCLLVLVQLPIILALYWVFYKGLNGGVDPTLLYSFVSDPVLINEMFLGINLFEKSILVAFLAGLTQFFQMKLAMPSIPKPQPLAEGEEPSFKSDEFSSIQVTILVEQLITDNLIPVMVPRCLSALIFLGAIATQTSCRQNL